MQGAALRRRRCPAAALHFFWGAVSIDYEKRCNHYGLIRACMLSGARRVHPVIVRWPTLRPADCVRNDRVRTHHAVPGCYATQTQFLWGPTITGRSRLAPFRRAPSHPSPPIPSLAETRSGAIEPKLSEAHQERMLLLAPDGEAMLTLDSPQQALAWSNGAAPDMEVSLNHRKFSVWMTAQPNQ